MFVSTKNGKEYGTFLVFQMSTLDFPVTVLSHKRRAVPLIHFSVSKAEDVGVTEHEADSSEAAADTKPSTTTGTLSVFL